jgi:hypothetical protein
MNKDTQGKQSKQTEIRNLKKNVKNDKNVKNAQDQIRSDKTKLNSEHLESILNMSKSIK